VPVTSSAPPVVNTGSTPPTPPSAVSALPFTGSANEVLLVIVGAGLILSGVGLVATGRRA
jgi:LPXTG-motif cell wall-anchored protein